MRRKQKLVLISNYKDREKGQKALQNLTRCLGQPLASVEYDDGDLAETVVGMAPSLLFLSGSEYLLSRPGTRDRFREEIELVKRAAFPILGICFGHQLIGTAFGVGMTDLGQMIRRFEPINVLDHSPLFNGLPSTITVAESHRQVLGKVPGGFKCLAHSSTSQIEAMCHESRPIYGLQFHPERADENHPHGQTLLRNMVELSNSA